jgi:hypothetical protein
MASSDPGRQSASDPKQMLTRAANGVVDLIKRLAAALASLRSRKS